METSKFRYDTSGKWFKGSLHTHSTYSDGRLPVKDVSQAYAGAGYDFVCLTDHWRAGTLNGNRSRFPLLMINGIELDGFDAFGSYYHVVAVGAARKKLEGYPFMDALDAARAEGAMLIWAHPHWTGNSFEEGLRHHFHGIEIYNHSSQCEVGKGYANLYWDAVLERNPAFFGVAVDDAHFRPEDPFWNGGWVVANAPECTQEAVLAALKNGNFYSSQGPVFETIALQENRITFQTGPIKAARLIGPRSAGLWIHASEGRTRFEFDIPADWRYVRLEIEDRNGRLAWTNPLFCESRP